MYPTRLYILIGGLLVICFLSCEGNKRQTSSISSANESRQQKNPSDTQQQIPEQQSHDVSQYKYDSTRQPMIGQQAPEFQLPALNGRTYSLSQFSGKYIVLTFLATWCPFCNKEAPNLEPLFQKYKDKGVQVLAIDVREPKNLVKKLTKKNNFTFPVLLDNKGRVAKKYAPDYLMPHMKKRHEVPIAANLIIDRQGKIRFYEPLDTESFDAELTALKDTLNHLITSH